MKRIGDMMVSSIKPSDTVGRRRVLADEKTVFYLAEKVIGELYGARGRKNISPRYWKKGKLFLACQSPLWANELWISRDELRERMNRELGYEGVSEIKASE